MGRELTQFKQGNPGGPGRPKGSVSLTTLLKKALKETTIAGHKLPDGVNAADFLIQAVIKHAVGGNGAYMKEIFSRVDGPPQEPADDEFERAVREAEAAIEPTGQDPTEEPERS